MSDTEDTERMKSTNSIYSNEKMNYIDNNIEKEELNIISTIEIIADLLVNICEDNKTKKIKNSFLLKSFTNKNIPSISIKDYLLRLQKHSKVNESTIILILIYIDRVCNMNHFMITYYNIHKLILVAFILAIKYNEDNYYSMNYYSKVGGISITELNNLELEYLIMIRYNLYIQTQLFEKYYNELMSLKNVDSENDDEYEEQIEDENEDEEREENKHFNNINNNINIKINACPNEQINNQNHINLEREIIRA